MSYTFSLYLKEKVDKSVFFYSVKNVFLFSKGEKTEEKTPGFDKPVALRQNMKNKRKNIVFRIDAANM